MPRTTPKTTVEDDTTGSDEPTVTDNPTPDVTPAPEVSPEPATELEQPQTDAPEAQDAPSGPVPDEYGRYRVRDEDTGHELTIHAAALPHGRFTVLNEPATDPLTGEPVPTVHKSPVETTTSGQQAETKENLDA